MNVRFVHDGGAIDFTPEQDVAAGSVVVFPDLVGITKLDIAAGQLGALSVVGVYDFPKATGTDTGIVKGVKVYWDSTEKQVTVTATDNHYVGKTVRPAGDDDDLARVRLDQ